MQQPSSPSAPSRLPPFSAISRTKAGRLAMVVNENQRVVAAVTQQLQSFGYEVHTAESGAAALERLRRRHFEVMLCDVRLPDVSGLEVVPLALEIDPHLAVLVVTSVNHAATAKRALERGAADYLLHPVEPETLKGAIREALAKRDARIEKEHLESRIREEVAAKTAELEREKEALRREREAREAAERLLDEKTRRLDQAHREVERLRSRPEERLCGGELIACLLGLALRHHDRPAEKARACEVERVLRHLEQRDGAADVIERRGGLVLKPAQARERPVEANACVGVGDSLGVGQRVVEDALGTSEIAKIRQRVAEVGREADVRGVVVRRLLLYRVEAGREEVDRAASVPERRVAAAESLVDIRPAGRSERLRRGLEALDRLCASARSCGREPERDARAKTTLRISGGERFVEDLLELALDVFRVLAEPEAELRVGQP
jgi:CheY-like chemotaxis protein